jgi:hypothetical protein
MFQGSSQRIYLLQQHRPSGPRRVARNAHTGLATLALEGDGERELPSVHDVARQRGAADNERCRGTGWQVAAMDRSAVES